MNPNSKKPGYLFFTPRTPWGTRAGQQSFRQHQQASENKVLGAIKKGAGWLGDHLFGDAEVTKTMGTGEPAEKSAVLGVHLGGGEPSTGEDPKGELNDWQNTRQLINEDRTTRERVKREQEAADQKSAAQRSIEKQQEINRQSQMSKAEATIKKFRAAHPELYRGN